MAGAQIALSFVLIVAGAVLNFAPWQRTVFYMLAGFLLISGILRVFGVSR